MVTLELLINSFIVPTTSGPDHILASAVRLLIQFRPELHLAMLQHSHPQDVQTLAWGLLSAALCAGLQQQHKS